MSQFPPQYPPQPGTPPPPYGPPSQPGYPQQPGQMPYPPQSPKQRGFKAWMRRHPIWTAIIALFILSSIVNGIIHGGDNTDTANTDATPVATSAPAQPTTPPSPTPTPKPQPTLTPAQRIQQQTLQLAQDKTEFGHDLHAVYASGVVTITETVGDALDNDGAKVQIKADCFNIQKAIWQAKVAGVTGVAVKIQGSLVDPYGKQSIGLVGSCLLSDGTAAKFAWDNLDYEQAWDNGIYDAVYLLPSLNS